VPARHALIGYRSQDYRGPLGIVLCNNGVADFVVKAGDRIAQFLLERVDTPEVIVVDELDDSERGAAGFGSTGVSSFLASATPPARPIVD